MKKVVSVLVMLIIGSSAWAEESHRLPEDRITLENGVPTVITEKQFVPERGGGYTLSGSVTVQVNTDPGVTQTNKYFYTASWFTVDDVLVEGSLNIPIAVPYGTWWLPVNPTPTGIIVSQNEVTVKLWAICFGKVAAPLVEAFGGWVATHDNP